MIAEAARAEILDRYQQHVERFDRAAESRRRLGLQAPASESKRPAEPAPTARSLTGRELSVLELIATGLTDAEIGQELVISEFTVKSHIKRLLTKLGARNRAHAVALGVRAEVLALAA